MKKGLLIFSIMVFMLLACVPIPSHQSPNYTSYATEQVATHVAGTIFVRETSTALSELTLTLVPLPIETISPTVTLTDVAVECSFERSGKLPLSEYEKWCNSGCPLREDIYMVIKPAEDEDRCDALFPLTAYISTGFSFKFPLWWTVHPVGVEGNNLLFETCDGRNVFVQLTRANLPLEQADEARYSYERSGPDPLVDLDENYISKGIQNVGYKRVLVLITTQNDLSIKRYFTIYDDTLYMFEIETQKQNFDDEDNTELLLQVDEIISSMQFVR